MERLRRVGADAALAMEEAAACVAPGISEHEAAARLAEETFVLTAAGPEVITGLAVRRNEPGLRRTVPPCVPQS